MPAAPASTKSTRSRRVKGKPSCESCYFGVRMLCALQLGGPCTTYRPDSPHGLQPPTQPMLLIGAGDAPAGEPELEPEPLAA